jgi:hypothetical protein
MVCAFLGMSEDCGDAKNGFSHIIVTDAIICKNIASFPGTLAEKCFKILVMIHT